MKASDLILQLPEQNTPDRESKIINFIGMGFYLAPRMVEVTSSWNGHTAILKVMSDALMIGEPDDFLRINATMEGEQRIADLLCMSMMTSKVADLVRMSAAVQIEPCTQTADSQMAYTTRMVKHNAAVTNRIIQATQASLEDVAQGAVGLVADVGKDWVLSNKLAGKKDLAANYGWHTKQAPSPSAPQNGPYRCQAGGYMWQTLGTAHNTKHVDYSQVVRLMSTDMIVDNMPTTFAEVAASLELHGLVSYEGPLAVLRHPDYVTVGEVMES